MAGLNRPSTPPCSPIVVDTDASPTKPHRLPLLLREHNNLLGMDLDRPASAPIQLPSDPIAYSFLGPPPVLNFHPAQARISYAAFLAKAGVCNESILRWISPLSISAQVDIPDAEPPVAPQPLNNTTAFTPPNLTNTTNTIVFTTPNLTNPAEDSSDEASDDAEDDENVVDEDLMARVAALGEDAVVQVAPDNDASHRILKRGQRLYSPRARIIVGNLPNDIDTGILGLAVEEEFAVFGTCYVHVFRGDRDGLRPYAIAQFTCVDHAVAAWVNGESIFVFGRRVRVERSRRGGFAS